MNTKTWRLLLRVWAAGKLLVKAWSLEPDFLDFDPGYVFKTYVNWSKKFSYSVSPFLYHKYKRNNNGAFFMT